MRLVDTLREQARTLHLLATSFEAHLLRDDLLILASRCKQLADDAEREITAREVRPISA